MKEITRRYLETLWERFPTLIPCREALEDALRLLLRCYEGQGKVLVCGNGGSAADSQHIVGELMKGFVLPRPLDEATQHNLREIAPDQAEYLIGHLQGALPALSLVGENALSTAYANDAAPDLCFAQQLLGLGCPGDVLIAISTSGNSANVLYAAQVAHAKGMAVIGMTGAQGNKLKALADCCILAPATDTYQIQEFHLPIYHTLCLALEHEFFGA